jgi:hypothetical protein
MKNEISNGLTIEQLEERMEFTTVMINGSSVDVSDADIANAERCSGGGDNGPSCYSEGWIQDNHGNRYDLW